MRRTMDMLAIAAALLVPGGAAGAEPAGNVIALRGKAVIERGDAGRFAKVRDAVQEQDVLLTRERSRLKVLFRNDSVLTLGARGKLVVRQYLAGAGGRAESLYELADGKLRAVVGGGSFKVQTPTAYAAARGTVFVMWYDAAANMTGIAVIEGGLEIRNIKHGSDRMIILVAGQMSTITGSEGPSPPEPFSLDLWGSGSADQRELADLADSGGDVPVEPAGDTVTGIQQGQPSGGGALPGQPGGDPLAPPVSEPPINQQPAAPVVAPIRVQPVFR